MSETYVKIISDHDSNALESEIEVLYKMGYELVGSVSATVAGTIIPSKATLSVNPTISVNYLYVATLVKKRKIV